MTQVRWLLVTIVVASACIISRYSFLPHNADISTGKAVAPVLQEESIQSVPVAACLANDADTISQIFALLSTNNSISVVMIRGIGATFYVSELSAQRARQLLKQDATLRDFVLGQS